MRSSSGDEPHSRVASEALNHLDGLYNLALWIVRDPAEAEDLVQETYLRALRHADQFRSGTNLRAWLFQILRNTFFTRFRRRGREPEAVDPGLLDALSVRAAPAGTVPTHAGGSIETLRADLAAALERLPEEYRTVVLLADLEDFTMAEVAQIMGCPVGTVKSRLSRARALLKEWLRDYVR